MYDVLIIGGGPAGASTAIHLALAGARVLVAEQSKFPRAKLCGEFISPECLEHFARLGVSARIEAAGGREVRETVFYAPSGRCLSVASEWLARARMPETVGTGAALGLSRAEMDERLLERAREVGVEVFEETQAVGLLHEDGRVRGVRLQSGGHGAQAREVSARLTIDATGRRRASAHWLARAGEERATGQAKDAHGWASRWSNIAGGRVAGEERARLVAFKAHLEGAGGDEQACEIYFYRGGYGGLSPVEGGRSNLCFIVRAGDVRALGSDPARVMREVVQRNLRAAETLRGARLCSEWLSVAIDGFGRREPAPARGLLTIGDAASFIDPFTGSGMLMALESGELAAQIVADELPRLRRREEMRHGMDEEMQLGIEGEGKRIDGQADELSDGVRVTENRVAESRPEELLSEPALFDGLANKYRCAYNRRFGARLRLCAHLRRAALAPSLLTEASIALLGASEGLRRRLAQATRSSTAGESFGASLKP